VARIKHSSILWLMLVAIALIAALAFLDEERESAAALSDFAQEQATLAQSLAASLGIRLADAHHDALVVAQARLNRQPVEPYINQRYRSIGYRPSREPTAAVVPSSDRSLSLAFPVQDGWTVDLVLSLDDLLSTLRQSERPNRVAVLLQPPGSPGFYSSDGRYLAVPSMRAALADGQSFVRLGPESAGPLGLPHRTALAGLSSLDAGVSGRWGVAVVASAERQRDRERWARWRLVLSVVTAGGMVLVFGGLAMRTQRKELTLQHRLELADLARVRDGRLERAARAATMGTLAVGVAHEISTPLGIIAGRAEQLLPRVAHDERLASSARIILEQTDRIHRVIRGLLGLARGDRPTAEPVEPEALVRGAVSLVEHRFEKAGVRLNPEMETALPIIHGDPRLLEHALVNLLLNACDACAQGGTVDVVATGDMASHQVSLAVIDDGPGISHADADRVLEPFFSTKPNGRGTGIGLVIVQEIVASHRGSLTLAPVVPHGTRATIRLPVAEDLAQEIAS
jgi:two-component system NtrC family sensor kinase